MNKNVFPPSLKFERKTKALNKTLWGFVGLISMFTVELFVIIFHLMLCSILNVESTFISDNSILTASIPVVIFSIIFGIGFYKFLNMLLHSYKFEDNKIIKGRIINSDKVKGTDLAFDTAMTVYMAKNIGDSKKVVAGNATINLNSIIRLIELNTNGEFVNRFFDTDIYRKKIYNNPRLLKESKYSLVYICDDNKKLVIPKLYKGINVKISSSDEKSLTSRILLRSLIVFVLCFLFSMIDLFIGINNNYKYVSNINNTCSNLKANLNDYGYNLTRNCKFEKIISDNRTSSIEYRIDKNGNITKVNLELYYDFSSYSDNELKYIISTLNTDFSNSEINDFIERVSSCVNGNCSYGKIKSGKNILRIDSSDGLVNIYNH